jgi:hypothetical protein
MKVGIITFHEIFNPGAFLQAYGTQTLVRRMGHDAEIIDYNPPKHRYHPVRYAYKLKWRLPLRLRSWADAFIRDRAFARSRSSHYVKSPYFQTKEELAGVAYDAILVGADIVWNFKLKRLGQDPVYFGESLNTKRLIAFAPSCGNCSVEDQIPEYVKSGLHKFTAIAVRDRNTAEIVLEAAGIKPRVICDPTFHLLDDLGTSSDEATGGDYILVYLLPGFTSASLVDEIQKLSASSGLPIYAVYYRLKWADRNLMDVDPFQWLEYIRGARYVFTNTFHGTIFSAFLRSDFVVEMNDAIRNKTLDMVSATDLEKRLYTGEAPVSELLDRKVDFDAVHDFFRGQAEEAEAFLRQELNAKFSD